MRKHWEEVKRRHKRFIRLRNAQIVDYDDKGGFSWLKWLNPKDGKSYIRARASANAATVNFKRNKNQKALEKIALASFSKRSRRNFHL